MSGVMRGLARRSAALLFLLALCCAGVAHAAPTLVRSLGNGVQVAVFSDHRLPIVQIQVLVPAGTRHEQPLEAGAATVTAAMLTRGTTSRTEAQFQHEVEALGGNVVGDAARDYATLTGAFRAADFRRGLELIADALINPIFDDAELSAARQELARHVLETRGHLDQVAEDHVWAQAFKGHPYAAPPEGTVEAMAGLTRARVTAFHRAQYRPDHAFVAIAGDVDPEDAFAALQEAFGGWAGRARNVAPTAPTAVKKPAGLEIRIVDLPGADQAEVRLVVPVAPRGAADAPALAVANDLLGGGFGSRLMGGGGRVLQAYSQLEQQREAGLLVLATTARTDSVQGALAKLRGELSRFASSPPGDAEIARSRRVLGRGFPLRNETLGAQEAQWLTAASLDLGNDYPDHYPERVEAVTAEDVRAVARRYFDPDHAEVVVVGAATALKPALEKLGSVEVLSIQDPPAPLAIAPALRMDEPDPESIQQGRKLIQQAVAAHGGLIRLKGIKDSRVVAELTLYHGEQSVVGKQTEVRREPGQLRSTTEFMQLTTIQAVHGDSAWTRLSAPGRKDSTLIEEQDGVAALRRAFASDVPHLLLTAASSRSRVAFRGQDEIGSTLADVVEVVGRDGERWVLFLDPRTHQLVAAEDNQGSPLKGAALRRVFAELRPEQGVVLPHVEERLIDGERTLTLKVSRVQINTGVSPDLFETQMNGPIHHRRR